ncbi:type II toxin-antitoxin system RelE/ParE family toxin [Lysobacter sp. 5GHs7-4]|uniref:type II toxin-antitoxin system RelE/ParE family toxin n=1 Tax=Lysobacter sp. 5GHs7-4 TaxID=2904253 RepID=UPI001E56B6A0|nr:type II toxin-antitoxin system RelE/ParE family toxin [Lysobacter sp. 5GHs7-4]UHQ23070.1 type II toxin-antitoxin system RelE/ParE family toxin [Lysobacter sp. 5GHs7-4]
MKGIAWSCGAKKELLDFPEQSRSDAGHALFVAQQGAKHPSAKPLKGFEGASVLEIVLDEDGDTYRAVYTVQFKDVVVVLHAFQKKSHKQKETPKRHIDLIERRLTQARKDFGGK